MQFRFQNLAPLCRSIRHNRKSFVAAGIDKNNIGYTDELM